MDSKRSLSEISHLFLSEIRHRQTGNGEKPRRIAPGKKQDDAVEDVLESVVNESLPLPAGVARVSVVLSSHLGEQRTEYVKRYAQHQAATESDRVGLIEIDRGEFVVSCFEAQGEQSPTLAVVDDLDGRRMSEALAELSFDVDRWLISLANPRTPEAREVLGAAPHWTLLTTADHDGVVATYRTLKGLAELGRPKLSLAVLDAADDSQASAVFRKLDAVSRQFLGCRMEAESPVRPAGEMNEHLLLNCRGGKDNPSDAPAPQWKVILDFLNELPSPREKPKATTEPKMKIEQFTESPTEAPVVKPRLAATEQTATEQTATEQTMTEVIELSPDRGDQSVLDAVVRQGGAEGRWVQCPIRPPMCPQAALAVDRDHRLVLLAVAGRGLSELRSIGLALKWMAENRELIHMALPQLAIDVSATPIVRLLVDHADLSGELLQPLLHSDRVTVQAYRTLKWGPKTGLLLEAA
jgi:hypothetical protein